MSIKQQLDELRKEYETATNERKKEIVLEAEGLKSKACYECQEEDRVPEEDKDYPFCSSKCHKVWGDKEWQDNRPRGQRQFSLDYIQKRLDVIKKRINSDESGQLKI